MNLYLLKIKIKSPFVTPLHSDTLYGHFCWGYRYSYGEEKLETFLEQQKENISLIFSNGFFENYLPTPVLNPFKPAKIEKFKQILSSKLGLSEFETLSYMKKLKGIFTVHKDLFFKYVNNFNELKLYLEDDFRKELKNEEDEFCKTEIVSHNTINRITGTVVKEGGFFQKEERFYKPDTIMDIYVKADETIYTELNEVLKYIEYTGYGADKSTGKGNFEIYSFDEYEFPMQENFNAVMTLSNTVPSVNDPVDATYNLITKYGKVVQNKNPFKKPVLMFTPGSVFRTKNRVNYLGHLVKNVHKDGNIVHSGMGIPVYLNVIEEG